MAATVLTRPAAAVETTCAFGGPTPGSRVIRADLPRGTSFVDLRLNATPPTRPVGDRSSWHLVQGIAILDARTGRLVASRVASWGSSPRRVVVRAGAVAVEQEVAAPDAPFVHRSGTPTASLPPGSYFIVGFGSDGDRRLPNPAWGAEVRLAAALSCEPVGAGEVFDVDHTAFTGGAQVSGYGTGVVDGASTTVATRRRLVFGVMDVATQLAGDARLDYELPGRRRGSVTQELRPFTSLGGRLAFRARAAGAFPLVLVAGVGFDA